MAYYKKLLSVYPFLIAVLIVLLCLLVCPLQLIGHTVYENASLEDGIFPNLDLSEESIVISEFTPQRKQLDSISFRFLTSGRAPDGTVTLQIYNQNEKKIYSTTLESGDIMNYRWISFRIEAELEVGEPYSLHLRAYDYEDASIALYSGGSSTGPAECGDLYYNGTEVEDFTPATIFTYTDKIDFEHALPYYAAFLILGLLLFAMCHRFDKTGEES